MRQVFFSGIVLAVLVQSAAGVEIIHSTATLSQPRCDMVATTAGGVAIFAGGRDGGGYLSNVDIYDSASGTCTADSLSVARVEIAAASVGNLALFAGGMNDTGGLDIVDIYNTQSATWSTATLSQPRRNAAAVTVGDTVMIAGGSFNWNQPSDVVDIYNATTDTWSTTTLPIATSHPIVTAVGDKGVFVLNTPDEEIAVYDTTTGTWSVDEAPSLLWARSAATVDDRSLIFTGEYNAGIATWYDPVSGESEVERVAQPSEAATTVGSTVLSAGYSEQHAGYSGPIDVCRGTWGEEATLDTHPAGDYDWSGRVDSGDLDMLREQWTNSLYSGWGGMTTYYLYSPDVHIYDADTDEWSAVGLSLPRSGMSATSAGDLALFAGGTHVSENAILYSDVVDIYRVVGPSAVPEPAIIGLSLAGIGMLGVLRRR